VAAVAELESVSKAFGQTQALNNVSLTVQAGESVAVLGPNGAGKTTAIRILSGLGRPDRGRVPLFDGDPTRPENRLRLGATPQETRFSPTLKVREVLALVADHHPQSDDPLACAETFELQSLVDRQIGGA